jgi:hypothetical protein
MNNEESQIEKFMCQALDIFTEEDLGFTEDLTEANIIFPDNYEDWGVDSEDLSLAEIFPESVKAAEYQGRKVTLNKPFRTPDAKKKFAVYTKNNSGKVVIVRFGDNSMSIKKNNPARRKAFRARHGCDKNPGPKWKAKWWSCQWSW